MKIHYLPKLRKPKAARNKEKYKFEGDYNK